MIDYEKRLRELEEYAEESRRKLEKYEAIGRGAKGGGRLSESFTRRLDELRRHHDYLENQLKELRVQSAQSWLEVDLVEGLLTGCARTGDRIEKIHDELD